MGHASSSRRRSASLYLCQSWICTGHVVVNRGGHVVVNLLALCPLERASGGKIARGHMQRTPLRLHCVHMEMLQTGQRWASERPHLSYSGSGGGLGTLATPLWSPRPSLSCPAPAALELDGGCAGATTVTPKTLFL